MIFADRQQIYLALLILLLALPASIPILFGLRQTNRLSSPALLLGLITVVGLLAAVCLTYTLFLRRCGFQIWRYRCKACRYQWDQIDAQPSWRQRMAKSIEHVVARRRRQKRPRKLDLTLIAQASVVIYEEDYPRTTALLDEALAMARANGNTLGVTMALSMLGMLALLKRDPAQARSLLEESAALAQQLGNWQLFAAVRNSLGIAALDSGDTDRAQQLFAEALTFHQKLGSRESIAWDMEGLAEVAATRQQMERAAKLGAAAQSLRAEIGIPMLAAMRRRFEHAMTAARTLLGEAAFATAWGQGWIMLQFQAIQYALED